MPSDITMTTFTFSVLHRAEEPPAGIDDAIERSDSGSMVGKVARVDSQPVPAERVADELRAMGSDATFFDD